MSTSRSGEPIKRVGIVFAGGPAPAANAVISAAAIPFLEDRRSVLGFFHGYSNLHNYDSATHPLLPGQHFHEFELADLRGLRNQRGINIGTARANPGRWIRTKDDLHDATKTAPLARVYRALVDLNVDALISIGGDDTLKTANLLFEFQKTLPKEEPRIRIIHVPKTIDNDYRGIDFTFGFFTAVDFMAKEVQNLRADAMATGSYFIVETMGRKAGWLSYGVAIAGEAHLVVAVEDVIGDLALSENGKVYLDSDVLTERIVELILAREQRAKFYGVIVLAEGLAGLLHPSYVGDLPRDEHGHIPLAQLNIGKLIAHKVAMRYEERAGNKKKITSVQLGYESRCATPHAFDVMLGSQLGIGAYRGLVEEGLDGHMVSVSGQLDLRYVPFGDLVNQDTLRTEIRLMIRGSDFHQLARFLETRVEGPGEWTPGQRREE